MRHLVTVLRIAPVVLSALALAGCGGGKQPAPEASASDGLSAGPWSASAAAPSPSAATHAAATIPSGPQPSASDDPAAVLTAWAQAVEGRHWRLVRAYWGQSGELSGMTATEFARKWSRLAAPRVAVAHGEEVDGKDTSTYTAHVKITDRGRTIEGDVELRRVNNPPDGSAEDLRWHIDKFGLAL